MHCYEHTHTHAHTHTCIYGSICQENDVGFTIHASGDGLHLQYETCDIKSYMASSSRNRFLKCHLLKIFGGLFQG